MTEVDSSHYEVSFAPQSAAGAYVLTVGPNITDPAGNAMDQNQDGINGEVPQDEFTANFSITAPPPPPPAYRYDFGTASSPVAAGYTQVTESTRFSTATGFGWQSGTIGSRDRGIPPGTNDLNRAFDFSADGTFAVNVPNGPYSVTVMMGDGSYAHGPSAIYLEGVQVDTVTTAAAQFLSRTYAVTVTGGQLDLRLKDTTGYDVATIDALQISSTGVSTPGPRVTAATPSGSVSGPIDQVELTFNEPIQPSSFTTASVDALTGPAGAITPTAVTEVDSTHYEVTFAPQSAAGAYVLTVGPNITDLAGNAMDQNQDGINGEVPQDEFTANFSITAPPPPPPATYQYDFGTATSPVAAGYTQVTDTTRLQRGDWLRMAVWDHWLQRPRHTPRHQRPQPRL